MAGRCAARSSRRSTTCRASSTASGRPYRRRRASRTRGGTFSTMRSAKARRLRPGIRARIRRRHSKEPAMSGDLGTTNLLLGIMAAVGVLEVLLLIGAALAGVIFYRRMMERIERLELDQVAPTLARLNAILEDVRGVTTKVREEAERVDHAIRTTIDRVDDTAGRVRSTLRVKTSSVVGILRGARVALESFF